MQDGNADSVSSRMMRWALDNNTDWDVVLGFQMTNVDKTLDIQARLKAAGFVELSEMMAMRAYRQMEQASEDLGD